MDSSKSGYITFDEYLSYLQVLMHGTDDEKAM
jgi:hypothetical protein